MKTNSSSVKWVVEVYPYPTDIPSSDPSISSLTQMPVIIGSQALKSSELDKISSSVFGNATANSSVLQTLGIKNVSINRAKQTPSASCSISVVGPLSPVFVGGNWVIVSSAQATEQSGFKTVVRFIGQIESISVNYTSSEGILQTVSSISVREWSSILQSQIMFDYAAVLRTLEGPNAGVAIFNILNQAVGGTNEITKLADTLKKAYDPFETAQIILKLLGLVSAQDELQKTKEVSNTFNKMALTPPKIPPAVLARLSIKITPGASSEWNGGFCNIVTGIKPPDSMSKSPWLGVLGLDGSPNLDEYKKTTRDNFEKRKFKNRAQNILTGLSARFDAWTLLNNYCDSTFNEVFTDMWYENDANNNVVGRPVVVVRDKPFLMKSLHANIPFTYNDVKSVLASDYTFYDDLPRIAIDSSSIVSFTLNNTFQASPNYFISNFMAPGISKENNLQQAMLGSIIRMDAEQERFGGHAMEINPQFPIPDLDESPDSTNHKRTTYERFFSAMSEINRLWYGYMYRMGSGSISIIENNYPLSIGFNVQFRIGEFELVGQIDSISTNFTIVDDGMEQTVTRIGLSRVVMAQKSNKSNVLSLLPPNSFGRLFDVDFANEVYSTANFSASPDSSSLVSLGLSTLKGFIS